MDAAARGVQPRLVRCGPPSGAVGGECERQRSGQRDATPRCRRQRARQAGQVAGRTGRRHTREERQGQDATGCGARPRPTLFAQSQFASDVRR